MWLPFRQYQCPKSVSSLSDHDARLPIQSASKRLTHRFAENSLLAFLIVYPSRFCHQTFCPPKLPSNEHVGFHVLGHAARKPRDANGQSAGYLVIRAFARFRRRKDGQKFPAIKALLPAFCIPCRACPVRSRLVGCRGGLRSEQARNAFAACTERVPNRLRAGTGFGLFAWLAQALLHACGLRPFPCWVVFAFAAKRRDGKRLLRILQKNVQKVCRLRAECLILSVWAWHSLRWVFPAFPDGHREERLSRPSL